jgi:hypothetical protein
LIYRIVKCGESFDLEASFPRLRLWRWLFGEPQWFWIYSYESLERAKQGRDYVIGVNSHPPEKIVVG